MDKKVYFAKFAWDEGKGPGISLSSAHIRPKEGEVLNAEDEAMAEKALGTVREYMSRRHFTEVPGWLYENLSKLVDIVAAMRGGKAYEGSWSTENPDKGELPR